MTKKKNRITVGDKYDIGELATTAAPLLPIFINELKDGNFQGAAIAITTSFLSSRVKTWVDEISVRIKEGRLKRELFEIENDPAFIDLLKYLSRELPDEIRWKAMCALYFAKHATDADEKQEELAHLLMDIVKTLNKTELVVVLEAYKMSRASFPDANQDLTYVKTEFWRKRLAENMGYSLPSLVLAQERNLIEKGLLHTFGDKGGELIYKEHGGLTDLGQKLCEFILKYK